MQREGEGGRGMHSSRKRVRRRDDYQRIRGMQHVAAQSPDVGRVSCVNKQLVSVYVCGHMRRNTAFKMITPPQKNKRKPKNSRSFLPSGINHRVTGHQCSQQPPY